MAYDDYLASRVRSLLAKKLACEEKKMFGGLCFLLNGNMLVGVWKESLIVRCGAEEAEKALEKSSVSPFDVTGKPMKGWIMVSNEGFDRDADLQAWLGLAEQFVATLPPK